mmetsp:Transcript_5245/g.15686  ORF Transcript_5245/g.15686 Transcript_5245/m.15686 type:complete len:151 (-) Transcript_5245:138-590(-)
MAFVTGGGVSLKRGILGSNAACTSRRSHVGPARSRMVTMKTVQEVSKDTFQDEVVSSDLPVLVDFYATWCGPCKLIAPVMEWAASEYAGKLRVVKINTEKNPNFVKQFDIHGLPTLVIFKDGDLVNQVEGAIGKQKVLDLLKDSLPELGV